MNAASVPAALAALSEEDRATAMRRFAVLRPHLENNVSLAEAARAAGVAERTARRWLAAYLAGGLSALARSTRTVRRRAGAAPRPHRPHGRAHIHPRHGRARLCLHSDQ